MDQFYEFKGFWFLPESPDNAYPGVLKIDPLSGPSLELIGAFNYGLNNIEIILGNIAGKYKLVTLYRCFETKRRMFGRPELSTLYCNFVFLGAHFNNRRQIGFHRFDVHYSLIDNWLNTPPPFEFDYNFKNYTHQVKYTLPPPIVVKLSDNLSLTVQATAELPMTATQQKEAIISQKTKIVFKTKRKEDFDFVFENAIYFQDFLTLVIQRTVYIKEFIGFCRKGNSKELQKVNVLFHIGHLPKDKKELPTIDMLLPFSSISKNFSSILNAWFERKKEYDTVLPLLVSVFYSPNMYASDRFLYVARSLEAFHRTFIKQKSLYKDRIIDILKTYSPAFNSTLNIHSKDKFAEIVKNYRHDFTHANPILSQKDKINLKAYILSEKLKLISSCAILNNVGISLSELKSAINKSRLYSHYRHKSIK